MIPSELASAYADYAEMVGIPFAGVVPADPAVRPDRATCKACDVRWSRRVGGDACWCCGEPA